MKDEQAYYDFCTALSEVEAGTVLSTSNDKERQLVAYGDNRGAYVLYVDGADNGAEEGISDMAVMNILGGKLPSQERAC